MTLLNVILLTNFKLVFILHRGKDVIIAKSRDGLFEKLMKTKLLNSVQHIYYEPTREEITKPNKVSKAGLTASLDTWQSSAFVFDELWAKSRLAHTKTRTDIVHVRILRLKRKRSRYS